MGKGEVLRERGGREREGKGWGVHVRERDIEIVKERGERVREIQTERESV